MRLTELFDRPVPWQWAEQLPEYKSAVFSLNNRVYKVSLTKQLIQNKATGEQEDMNVWNTEFQDILAQNKFGITGKMKSQAGTVFSTVITILTDFKKSNPTAVIQFTAEEPSRQKLYNRILNALEQSGYQVQATKSPNGKMGYLVR